MRVGTTVRCFIDIHLKADGLTGAFILWALFFVVFVQITRRNVGFSNSSSSSSSNTAMANVAAQGCGGAL